MSENSLQDTNIIGRLRLLMLSRVIITTFLLGIAIFFRVRDTSLLMEVSQPSLYIIVFLTYFLSVCYLLLLKIVKNLKINIYVQCFFDVMLITGLVYYTGGIRSVYSVFYPLVIIYSVLFLARNGGLIIASACGIFYGLLIDMEYYGVIYPLYLDIDQDYHFNTGYIFSRILIHILSFYIIAFLASFVVEQEKRVRILLAEKENAFDQLDLLHRSIIESVDAGILTISLQNKIKSFNRGAEEITGFAFAEIANKNIDEIFPGYTKMLEKMNKEGNDQSSKRRVEMAIPGKGGINLILGCSVSPLHDHKGRRIGEILIFQDLTSTKKMEEALEKNRRLAFIGEMAASLAHEMRNPMASISGSIQLLKRDLFLSATDEKLMQIILRGRDQLENFIKDFLLIARPTMGVRERFSVVNVIKDVIESVKYIPDWDQKYEIIQDVPDPSFIYANKSEMRQVIWNLVINAVQSMPDGGTLSVTVRDVNSDDCEDYLEMRVTDTGEGIGPEDHKKIFEPFYTTKEKGIGLGLAIVNRIIESYSGKIKIESELGKGTSFIVSIPSNIR